MQTNTLKIWNASYYWGCRGAFEEKEYVVVAETKEVALGLVLTHEASTNADEWTIDEIPSDVAGIHYISSREN